MKALLFSCLLLVFISFTASAQWEVEIPDDFVTHDDFLIRWNHINRSTYKITIKKGSSTIVNNLNLGSDLGYFKSSLLASTTYTVSVTRYVNGLLAQTVTQQVATFDDPGYDNITGLSAFDVYNTHFKLKWDLNSNCCGQGNYQYFVLNDNYETLTSGFTTGLQVSIVGSESYGYPKLEPGTPYYVFVKIKGNYQNIGDFSEIEVTTDETIYGPEISTVHRGMDRIRFQHTSIAYYVDEINIQIATDASFSNLIINEAVDPESSSNSEFFVDGLTPGTSYYLRIRAGYNGGYSAFSETKSFVTHRTPVLTVSANPEEDVFDTSMWPSLHFIDNKGNVFLQEITLTLDDDDNPDNGHISVVDLSVLDDEIAEGDVVEEYFSGLTADTDYYLRIDGLFGYQVSGVYERFLNETVIRTLSELPAPEAGAAYAVTSAGFKANRVSDHPRVTDYFLDVSTQSDFSSFVSGYQHKELYDDEDYTVSGLSLGTTYYYRIHADYDIYGNESSVSNVIEVTTQDPPGAPTLIHPVLTPPGNYNDAVTLQLNWLNDVSGAVGTEVEHYLDWYACGEEVYDIYGGAFSSEGDLSTEFQFSSFGSGNQFNVYSVNESNERSTSKALLEIANCSCFDLTTVNSFLSSKYLYIQGGGVYFIPGQQREIRVQGVVDSDIDYYYEWDLPSDWQIVAYNSHKITVVPGNEQGTVSVTLVNPCLGEKSNPLTLEVYNRRQTIVFEEIDNKVYGDQFTLVSEASSGLEVVYEHSGPVSIDEEGVVIVTGVGSASITARQSGDDNYYEATPITRTFSISKAPLSVTANNLSALYGLELAPEVSYGGFVLEDNENYLQGVLAFEAISENNVGNYPDVIIPYGLTSDDYEISFFSGDLEVTALPLTIMADNKGKVYGASDPELTYDIMIGALEGDDQLAGAISRQAGEDVGEYDILQGTLAASSNYSITFNSGTFSIEKAIQELTFGTLSSSTFGDDPLSLFAVASSELAPTFTSSDLSVATISGSTVTITGAGTTTITAAQAGDDNYLAAAEVEQELVVNKAPQVITFGALEEMTFGDETFGLSASGGASGIEVIYSSSDESVATISGNSVIITGAGTTTITAAQAGDDNYLAAAEVEQELVVNKAPQVITFGALEEMTFGDETFDLSASGGASGIEVVYSSSDESVATISGNSVIITGAGTTTITAAQAGDDNYLAAAEVEQELVVNKAPQVITFGALEEMTFGDETFGLSASGGASGIEVIYSSSDESVATISGNSVIITGAGTTTITAAQAGDDNYLAAAEVEQELVVDKAPQVITFEALEEMTFGDETFGLSASGGASGIEVIYSSSDESVATISGSSVIITGAGTTTITAAQAGDDNYLAAAEVEQELVVNKAPQVITFGALEERTFGDETFDLSASGGASGIEVIYSSSDESVATISGSSVIITGAGTTTITATQAGDDNYYAAAPVDQGLTVRDPSKTFQSITFGALETKTYGDASFDLGASASSGLEITYVSSDVAVATISGNSVTIIGAGTTTITASQVGNEEFDVASDVAQMLTVNKAGQLISFGELDEKAVNDKPFDLIATSSSYLEVAFSSSDQTVATISGKTVSILSSGTTTITATQAGSNNYLPASKEQILSVSDIPKLEQTIAFSGPDDKVFGDAPFELIATTTSGLIVSFESSDESVAIVSGSTLTIVGVGTTTITASQAGDLDFVSAESVDRSFEVSMAELVVTPDDQEVIYGQVLPHFTYSISGFVNGEDDQVLLALPQAGVERSGNLDAGTYEIIASGGEAANYSFTYEEGRLTIGQAIATLALTGMEQEEDGSEKKPQVTTDPPDLNFIMTFNGEADAPVAAGSYDVFVEINETNYQGSASGTFVIATMGVLGSRPQKRVNVYPNPASRQILVKTPEPGIWRLYELNGGLAMEGRSNVPTDISRIEQGIYIMQIFREGKLIDQLKVIKKN
ncbi:MBG domain-containing protein [Marinoscillum sp.]|uniref:MBG domain-containing protein n=1 Tax=Marinoscillum sp. TaxID=2024838 RepID=UPI003BAB1D38